jgi:acetyltransferase-like isoleucine patch superfamily enzyme
MDIIFLIKYAVKGVILNVIEFIIETFVPKSRFKKFRRIIFLRKFERKDAPACAVELARDLGVKVGENCRFYGVHWGNEPFLIEIGDNVLLAAGVHFINHDSAVYLFRHEEMDIVNNYGKIKIGENSFIGVEAIIMPNVEIGKNCIIAAGAVVFDSFPDDSVIMGNPAKVVFKTSIYKKMKLNSKLTVRNKIAFPEFDFLPPETRKQIILSQIGDIPIRKARIKRIHEN